ncbi:MAG: signal peptidase II [Alphaproteobacteria bacterium]
MLRLGLGIAAAVAVADQVVKWWAMDALMVAAQAIEVLPFFNLVMVWNRGISFGMFGGGALPPWLLAAFAGAIAVGLGIWLARVETRLLAVGIGLVIGGALGNIVDRLRFGAVADFLDFHVAGYHWPAFNLADAAITIGVVLLLIDALLISRERPT